MSTDFFFKQDGPATACGMKNDDIITALDGEAVVDKKGFVGVGCPCVVRTRLWQSFFVADG